MVIKSGNISKMESVKPQETSRSEEININNIKDEVYITDKKSGKVSSKVGNVLKRYKELKQEQNKGNLPWWGELADVCHVQADIVEGLGMTGAIHGASIIGSGIGAIGLGSLGVTEIKKGLLEKDNLKVIGGTSAILAGAASGADFIGNMIEGHGLLGAKGTAISGITGTAAQVFGVAHGTIDIALGGRQVIKGIKEKNRDSIIKGGLDIGIGSTMIMGSAGIGGAPMVFALGGLFVTQLAYTHRNVIAEAGKEILDKIKS